MTRSKEFYLLILAYALVEIRAAEGDDAARFAADVADTLHHLPEALTLDWSAERDARVYEQMRAKAGVQGLLGRLGAGGAAAPGARAGRTAHPGRVGVGPVRPRRRRSAPAAPRLAGGGTRHPAAASLRRTWGRCPA